jgi:hypothetical protein
MATDAPNARINYAAAPRESDFAVARGVEGEIRFELGPESASLFIARMAPWAVLAGLLLAIVAWRSVHAWNGVIRQSASIATWLMLSILTLIRLVRGRHTPRAVGIAEGQLFYIDGRTQGQPMGIRPAEVTALRVYRSWWRPWVFELTTVPPAKWLGISATSPVVLLVGLDWQVLDRIRWELSVILGLESISPTTVPNVAPR